MTSQVELSPRSLRVPACLLMLWAAGCGGDSSSRRFTEGPASPPAALDVDAGVAGVLREHIARYPEMEVQDLYKLVHQAALGSAHALEDSVSARERLEKEVAALRAVTGGAEGLANEPLAERLTPGGELVRLNLRPYLASGGDIDGLWEAFMSTAEGFEPSVDSLRVWWSVAESLAGAGELPFSQEALHAFYVRQGLTGFAASRHSSHYQELYRPAYRVIEARQLSLPSPR